MWGSAFIEVFQEDSASDTNSRPREKMSPGLSASEIHHTEISVWWYTAVVNIRTLPQVRRSLVCYKKNACCYNCVIFNEDKTELQGRGLLFICLSKTVMGKPRRSCLRMAWVFQHTQNEGKFHFVNVGHTVKFGENYLSCTCISDGKWT